MDAETEPLTMSSHNLVHWHFIRYVMSDIYALLDFLSGRAKPSLTIDNPLRKHHRADTLAAHGQSEAESGTIGDDFVNQSAFFSRLMKIGTNLACKDGDISEVDAAFLIEARDRLNIQAKPATGTSIVFTLRVVEKLRSMHMFSKNDAPGARYYIPDQSQENVAAKMANFVKAKIRFMFILLVITVLLSAYVAWGKLLLDTRDQVNRDIGANFSAIASTMNEFKPDGSQQANDLRYKILLNYCSKPPSYLADQSCTQRTLLDTRKKNIHELIASWTMFLKPGAQDDEKVEQWSITLIGVLGNYLLPVLYGALGAVGFVLRRLNGQLADCLLTPRELRASQIRIALGTVTGACIGLFVNSSAGSATVSGLGGAAVTLSASGVAFLAGYGVEGVFKMMDWLINHTFKIGEDPKEPTRG